MNPKAALRAIKDANQALSTVGARYWLDCGSLLGAVREGGIMAHDLDVDFSCADHTKHEEIDRAMQTAGFEPYRTHGTPEMGYEQRYVHSSGVRVDIFYFYPGTVRHGKRVEDPKVCWQGSYGPELIVSEFDAEIVSETTPFTFKGVTVPVPVHYERMLEARYGDWRTPVTKWDYRTDPNCIVRDDPMGDVTFLIKTFMRYNLARRAIVSIRELYGDVPIVLVDDSDAPQAFGREMKQRGVEFIRLPYDSGLSAGRNAGVDVVKTHRVIVLDDDMVLTGESRFGAMLSLLDHADLVCGAMRQNHKMIDWHGTYAFPKDGMRLVPYTGGYTKLNGVKCAEVDFGLNVIASTVGFLKAHPWDPEQKVMEHTSFFVALKQAGARVLFTPECVVDHKPHRDMKYREFRRRKEFRLRFFHKHGIKYHIGYTGHRDNFTREDQAALEYLLAEDAVA